jgi:putative FmdB family regulatory protein
MPIYEYVCNACGHEFEEWQKINDSPVRKCPKCSKRRVERLVSLSAFHLKGSGWYVTDYGGKKSGSAPNEESKDKDSTESKPAKKKKKKKSTKAAKKD